MIFDEVLGIQLSEMRLCRYFKAVRGESKNFEVRWKGNAAAEDPV